MNLACVRITPDGFFHEIENDRRLFLDDIYGAPRGARIRARGAALECERTAALAERRDVVKAPGLDGRLFDGADDGNAVGVELEVHHSIFYGHGFGDLP